MTRIVDLINHLKTYTVRDNVPGGSSAPFYELASDLADLLDQSADPGSRNGRPRAGGMDLRQLDVANLIRVGLPLVIDAHRTVEAQRDQARAQTRDAEIKASSTSVLAALGNHAFRAGTRNIEYLLNGERWQIRCRAERIEMRLAKTNGWTPWAGGTDAQFDIPDLDARCILTPETT